MDLESPLSCIVENYACLRDKSSKEFLQRMPRIDSALELLRMIFILKDLLNSQQLFNKKFEDLLKETVSYSNSQSGFVYKFEESIKLYRYKVLWEQDNTSVKFLLTGDIPPLVIPEKDLCTLFEGCEKIVLKLVQEHKTSTETHSSCDICLHKEKLMSVFKNSSKPVQECGDKKSSDVLESLDDKTTESLVCHDSESSGQEPREKAQQPVPHTEEIAGTKSKATLARLASLRITTSHTYLYKKLDEYGAGYGDEILNAVKNQCLFLNKNPGVEVESDDQQSCDHGRKITIDNFDYKQNVHHMTEEHQNIDVHLVSVMSTENRIGAVEYSDQKKKDGIMKLENGKCIPSDDDHRLQRKNFITLVGRILVANIPCLKFLADVITSHIPHKYSSQMAKKTNTTLSTSSEPSETDIFKKYKKECGKNAEAHETFWNKNRTNIQQEANKRPGEAFYVLTYYDKIEKEIMYELFLDKQEALEWAYTKTNRDRMEDYRPFIRILPLEKEQSHALKTTDLMLLDFELISPSTEAVICKTKGSFDTGADIASFPCDPEIFKSLMNSVTELNDDKSVPVVYAKLRINGTTLDQIFPIEMEKDSDWCTIGVPQMEHLDQSTGCGIMQRISNVFFRKWTRR